MKRIIIAALILSFVMFSCSKRKIPTQPEVNNNPPASTATTVPASTLTSTTTRTITITINTSITATSSATQTGTAVTETITPTFTNTAIDTVTLTETGTATEAPSAVDSATITPTDTQTPVNTAIITSTDTPLDTLTITETTTPTVTETAVDTATITSTETPMDTLTITETTTPTVTETAVDTATITCTDTEADTQTITETITNTSTPTITSTSTDTPIPYSDIVTVPGGTFTQTDGTNSFSHTISTFMMGKYLVTYNLWHTVYQWAVANGYTFQYAGTGSGYVPVVNVNWRDVMVWCNAYSQYSGLTPCYTYSSAVIKDSTNAAACDNAVCTWTNNGYRLPSEGEYQYAASYIDGSSWTPYNYASGATADYTNEAATDLVGWDSADSGGTIKVVGSLAANALGIYDMSGNVFEWGWDWNGTYPTTASTDYRGPASGAARTLRGGDFLDATLYLQVGMRWGTVPSQETNNLGFRFARTY